MSDLEALRQPTQEKQPEDLSYEDSELMQEFSELPLVSKSYRNAVIDGKSIAETVVVIGGETHGISSEAKAFTHRNYGERLYIPMANKGINSLNVVSATSVIL